MHVSARDLSELPWVYWDNEVTAPRVEKSESHWGRDAKGPQGMPKITLFICIFNVVHLLKIYMCFRMSEYVTKMAAVNKFPSLGFEEEGVAQ